MLLRFSFSNFRSFRDEQELSLVASPIKGAAVPKEITGVKEGVLPVAAIYGANASGKTNVLRALGFVAEAVTHSHSQWQPDRAIPRSPFLGNEGTPSRFSVDFMVGETRYHYGFSALSSTFVEEWLHAYPHGGKKQTWFRREVGSPTVFGTRMPGDNRTIEKLTRKNSLFLSAAAQNNHALLSPIFAWFSKSLSFIASREDLISEVANGYGESAFKGRIVKMMEAADLGITDIRVEQETPPEHWKDAMTAFLKVLVPDVQNVTHGRRNVVKLTHRVGDNSRAFSLADESNGTITYLALLGPVLKALETGGTLCVDELDSSLHPNLTIELMKMFQQSSSNAQLIFNTHDTNLLGGSLLRRDQIWFTEKKPDGSSSLYPLTDFSPRQHENLEGGYLQGRYGGVPFLNPEGLSKLVGRGDDGN